MKAIHQLITYFHSRNRFSRSHMDQFIKKGFWGLHTEADLRTLEKRLNEPFFFQATGDATGPLWGTDIYTSDSSLGKACVHAGILQVGESAIVKVTIVAPLPVFQGSSRNGVVSNTWTTGWSGAYKVEALDSVN
jgi:hypothetical protein